MKTCKTENGFRPRYYGAARAIVVSLSGFGNTLDSPYRSWPAYASIVEAMSGIYDYKRIPEAAPTKWSFTDSH